MTPRKQQIVWEVCQSKQRYLVIYVTRNAGYNGAHVSRYWNNYTEYVYRTFRHQEKGKIPQRFSVLPNNVRRLFQTSYFIKVYQNPYVKPQPNNEEFRK